MKTPHFSLTFLLAMGFPFVLLAITPTKIPEGLTDDELEGSGTDSEDDDLYSGSGSGDGIVFEKNFFNEEHTTYHTLPSTVSNHLYSSSQVTMAKTTSEMTTTQHVHIGPEHHDLPVVETTTAATVTGPVSSTTISKDTDIPIVPKVRIGNSQPRGFEPKHNFTEVTSVSLNVHTTIPDHGLTVTNDESLAVSRVVTTNEMMTTMVKKSASIDEVLDMGQNDSDIYLIETIETKIAENESRIPDSKTPEEKYPRDASASRGFLERSELLAATVAAGFVGLVLAVLLVVVLVYRMKKKDEGSYTLDESKQPNVAYQKPQRQEEFYA
ncbi:uncharacterized protein LOC144493698 [Mustelus asterias]